VRLGKVRLYYNYNFVTTLVCFASRLTQPISGNTFDAVNMSPRLRQAIAGDPLPVLPDVPDVPDVPELEAELPVLRILFLNFVVKELTGDTLVTF